MLYKCSPFTKAVQRFSHKDLRWFQGQRLQSIWTIYSSCSCKILFGFYKKPVQMVRNCLPNSIQRHIFSDKSIHSLVEATHTGNYTYANAHTRQIEMHTNPVYEKGWSLWYLGAPDPRLHITLYTEKHTRAERQMAAESQCHTLSVIQHHKSDPQCILRRESKPCKGIIKMTTRDFDRITLCKDSRHYL